MGEEQALEIDRLLRRTLLPDLYNGIVCCGTSAQFQGDERDVVFLSVVDAPTGEILHLVTNRCSSNGSMWPAGHATRCGLSTP